MNFISSEKEKDNVYQSQTSNLFQISSAVWNSTHAAQNLFRKTERQKQASNSLLPQKEDKDNNDGVKREGDDNYDSFTGKLHKKRELARNGNELQ